jgi:hypothetical protein
MKMNKSLLMSVVLLLAACAPARNGDSDAADRAAIIDLQNRYVLAMDYFDADGYSAVFTEDGVLDWARGEVKHCARHLCWMNYGNNADRRKIEWLGFGSWDDQFVKIDGQWLFKRHTIYNEGNPNRFTAGQANPLQR